MLYQTIVFIHLLSAIVWVGGTLFLVIVMVPLARREMLDSGPVGAVYIRQAAQRFVPVAWASITLLILTGTYLGWAHWGVTPENFFTDDGIFIQILRAKVGLTVAVIALSFVHDFVLGPKLARQLEASPKPSDPTYPYRGRRLVLLLARLNLLLALAILALAVLIIRP
jgi:copper resistance protein D